MIPPSLFKAGDFAISKRGSVLQIVKAWPQTELFGLMAGEHRGWMYTVEDDKGRRFTTREELLTPPPDTDSSTNETLFKDSILKSIPQKKAVCDDKDLFDDDSEEELVQAVESGTNIIEDIVKEFGSLDDYDDDEDMKDFANLDTYDWEEKTKPLPTKRKCFELGTPPPSFKKLTNTSHFQSSSKKNSATSPALRQVGKTKAALSSVLAGKSFASPALKPVVNFAASPFLRPEGMSISSVSPSLRLHDRSISSASSRPDGMSISSVSSRPDGVSISSVSSRPDGVSISSVSSRQDGVSISSVSSRPDGVSISSASSRPDGVSISSASSRPKSVDISIFSTSPAQAPHRTSPPPLSPAPTPDVFPPPPLTPTRKTFAFPKPRTPQPSPSPGPLGTSTPTPEDPVLPEEKRGFLSKEERKSKLKPRIEPKDSCRKTISIGVKFENYIKSRGETRPLELIPADELSEMLSSFWTERRKEDGGIHDVTTLNSEFARLSAYIKRATGLNPTNHPDFEEYRITKEAKLKQSKQEPGNGQL